VNDVAAPQATGWGNPLDRLWSILAWPGLTVILLVWVAVVLALSAVIPQAPPNIEDPIVRSQWLANIPISVRPVVERLQSFGLFSLLDTVWLRLPLVLLLTHALVVLANLGPAIWHRLRGSSGEVSPLGRSFQLGRDASESVERVCQQLTSLLEKVGYRVLSLQDKSTSVQDQEDFIAWRWRWSWLGLAGIYLGLGLASVGLILAGWLGQVQEVNLEPDNPTPLPIAGAPNLVLEAVAVTGDDPLRPATGVAAMRMATGVGESQNLALRLHGSHLLRGIWLTLAELRPMVEVTAVEEETGEDVLLQPFSPRIPALERVRLPLKGDPETRFVGVPSENVTLQVNYVPEAEHSRRTREILEVGRVEGGDRHSGPNFSLSFFRGAEASPSRSASLPSGGEVTFDGVRYQVTFDYNVMLRVNRALWWIAVAVGWAVAALSSIVLTVVPPVYAQGSVAAAETGCRVILTIDSMGDAKRRLGELRALITPDT
jgi:hypothetical protein